MTDLRDDMDRVYTRMISSQVATGMAQTMRIAFFSPFQNHCKEYLEGKISLLDFCDFLVIAKENHKQFSLFVAEIIIEHSSSRENKSTPVARLAKEIREDVLEGLDEIVLQYNSFLDDTEDDLESIDVSRSAVEGAVAGKILGKSSTRSGNLEATIGALAAAGQAFSNIKEHQERLIKAGLLFIELYIEKLKETYFLLTDYALIKILGENSSDDIHEIVNIQSDIQSAFDKLEEVKNEIESRRKKQIKEDKRTDRIFWSWIIALILFLFSIVAFVANDPKSIFNTFTGFVYLIGGIALIVKAHKK